MNQCLTYLAFEKEKVAEENKNIKKKFK